MVDLHLKQHCGQQLVHVPCRTCLALPLPSSTQPIAMMVIHRWCFQVDSVLVATLSLSLNQCGHLVSLQRVQQLRCLPFTNSSGPASVPALLLHPDNDRHSRQYGPDAGQSQHISQALCPPKCIGPPVPGGFHRLTHLCCAQPHLADVGCCAITPVPCPGNPRGILRLDTLRGGVKGIALYGACVAGHTRHVLFVDAQ